MTRDGGQVGYRGSLPPRTDRMALPWLATVVAVFVLVFLLAFLGVPSRFFPSPSIEPNPSVLPSGSAIPSGVPSGVPSASQ